MCSFKMLLFFYFYPASVGNLLAWVLEIYTLTSHGTELFLFQSCRSQFLSELTPYCKAYVYQLQVCIVL